MITHYLDLEVETKGIRKDMRFYITNIGKEDLFLGYPWLAAYEPRFIWKDATIGEEALPVIIRSINPTIPRLRPTIARSTLEELKLRILHQLEEQSTLVKKQPSQDVLHGDEAEEELGLARLVSSYTLPHQNSQPGGGSRQTARSKVLSRRARDT